MQRSAKISSADAEPSLVDMHAEVVSHLEIPSTGIVIHCVEFISRLLGRNTAVSLLSTTGVWFVLFLGSVIESNLLGEFFAESPLLYLNVHFFALHYLKKIIFAALRIDSGDFYLSSTSGFRLQQLLRASFNNCNVFASCFALSHHQNAVFK